MVINHRLYNKRKNTLKKVIIAVLLLALAGFGCFYGVSYAIKEYHKNEIDFKNDPKFNDDKTVYVTLPGASKIKALIDDYDATDSIWTLVSKTRPISTNYVPTVSIPNVATNTSKSDYEQSVRTDISSQIESLFKAASNDGYPLMIGSGYRPSTLQEYYYNSAVNAYGEEEANRSTAKPGQSEHQTGLAVDISPVSRECYIETCFSETPEGIWLAENSYKYGFILRYPSGKEAITGYEYEPWHFRYVGVDLATAIYESGLTLDEAWSYLKSQ